jgi:putative inorganic carbon (HCO3(-)) transporter
MSEMAGTPPDHGVLLKKAVKILTIILFVLVPLAFTTHLHNTFYTIKLVIFRALLLIMIPCACYVWYSRTTASSRDYSLTLSVLAFISVSFLATMLSISPLVSTAKFIELLSYGALYFIWTSCLERHDVRPIFKAVMLSSLLASIYSLLQHCGMDLPGIVWSDADMVRTRSISTFGNPTFLAGFLVMVLPLIFYLFVTEKEGSPLTCTIMKVLYIISWVFGFSALLLSYTRGSWCAFFISSGVLLLFLGKTFIKNHRRILWMFMAALIFLVCAVMVLQLKMKSETSIMARMASCIDRENIHLDRLFLWKIGMYNFSDHWPLGSGPGTFAYVFPRYRFLEPPANRARVALPEACHNEFIEIASSTGAIGLLSFLALLISFFYLLFRLIKKGGEEERTAGAALAASAMAYIGHNMFLYPTISTELIWWLLLSIAVVFLPVTGGNGALPDLPGFRKKIILWAVLIISAFLFYGNLKTVLGSYHVNKAKNLESERRFREALASYDAALNFEPLQSRYYLYRGKMLEQVFGEKPITGLPEEIIKSYRMAIALNELDPYPWADLGRFLAFYTERFDRSSLVKAEESYGKALSLDPYNPLFRNDLGNLYAHLGKYEEAKCNYLRGLELFPDSPLILLNMASLSWQRKESEETRSYLRRVLSIEPDNDKALQLLKRVNGHENKDH